MNYSDIMEITNNVHIDEKEFSDIKIELTDLEVKNIKKNLKKNLKSRKRSSWRKFECIALIVIILGTIIVLNKPVFADKINILDAIYERLGYYREFKEISQFVGETKEIDGYKIVIDKLILVPDRVKIAVKISSQQPLDTAFIQNFNCFVQFSGVNPKGGSSNNKVEYIDDKNVIIIHESKIYGDEFKKKGDMSVSLNSCENFNTKFDFKVNFEKSFNKIIEKDVEKSIPIGSESIYIKNMISSDLGTTINFKKFDFFKYRFLLEVDNKIYSYFGAENTSDELTTVVIENLTYDLVKKANSIKCIPIHVENLSMQFDDLMKVQKSEALREDKIILPKDIISPIKTNFVKDIQGEVYKIERINNKIRVYYDCNESTLTELSLMYIHTKGEKKLSNLIIEKDSERVNGYFIEINGTEYDKEYELVRSGFKVKYIQDDSIVIK